VSGAATGPLETGPLETVLVSGGAAVTAGSATAVLGVCGLLPAPVAALAVLLVLAAAAGPVLWPTGAAARNRARLAQPVVVACGVVSLGVLLARTRAAESDPAALVEGIGSTMSYPLALLLVVQLASAVTVRHVGMVLVASLLAVLLAVGTAPDGSTVDLVSGLGLCLAIGWSTGLVTLWLLHRAKDRLGAQHVMPGGRPPSLRVPVGLVAGSVAVALATLLLPQPDGIRPETFAGAATGLGDPSSAGAAGSGRSPQSYLSATMDLDARGELPDTPVVAVPTDSPALWASTVMVDYSGRGWGPGAPIRSAPLVPRDATGDYDLRRGATAGSPPGAADRADLVRPLDPGVLLPLLAPGRAVSVRIDRQVVAAGTSLFVPLGAGQPYLIRSTGAVEDPVTPADTALPSSVPARVRELAVRLTRDAPTVEAKVAAIESYLHDTMRYRLDSPVPDEDEDAVDDFLFESREGFCEHFASAEAVLLRAVGVPARLVTGFAGGTPQNGNRIMLGSDAHAWVQVSDGGDHWFWTDPTAGATPAEDRSELRSLWDLVRDNAKLLGAIVLVLLVLALGALVLVPRVRARRAAQRASRAPLDARVLLAFARLEAALAGSHLARPPDGSVEEMWETLRLRWPGGLPETSRVAAALRTVQRILYGSAAVPAQDALDAVAAMDLLASQAVDLLPRRRPHLVR
jgi:transglutaminase-like putative cysteine protease